MTTDGTVRLRLGGDPADDEYPDKPLWMRWATYNRVMDRLAAADAVTDERLKTAGAIVDEGGHECPPLIQAPVVPRPDTAHKADRPLRPYGSAHFGPGLATD
jgi:hypothetical protein